MSSLDFIPAAWFALFIRKNANILTETRPGYCYRGIFWHASALRIVEGCDACLFVVGMSACERATSD